MRAAIVTAEGLTVGEKANPVPGLGQLLVRVRGAGLNGADMLQVRGGYPAPAGSPPDVPGLELAGEVVAVGPEVSRFGVGDRVMAVVGGGGQAELCLVHERCALAVPNGLAWDQAGGFPEAFTTAHDALFTQAGLGLGERVLITGAAGGVGTAGVQLAAAAGARVVASARNREHWGDLTAFGADEVVAPEDAVAAGPFDVVLELVGGPGLADTLSALATGGRIAVIGVGAGSSVQLNLHVLMQRRGRIHGSTLRARPLEAKADAARRLEAHVLPHLGRRLRVPVAATFPLADAPAAYERFRAGGKLGKIVLVP